MVAAAGDQNAAALRVPEGLDFQPQSVAGKNVLVTGGTTGIGRAIALLLADRGANVMIFGRHRKELDEALADLRRDGRQVHGLTADQSKLSDVARVFDSVDRSLGPLDILINNAALAADGVEETEQRDIQYVIQSNLLGYVACAKEAVQRMTQDRDASRGHAHIVLIGSMSADVREGGSSVYVATKAGIQGFSEAFRKEVNKQGIKVTLIEPGAVGSDMQPKKWTHERRARKQTMLKAEDIAVCVYYCLVQPERCDVVEVKIRPHLQEI